MNLKFSIIIPVYNRPKEICELLQSLLEQNFDDEFEVIIVEDGSLNSSEEIVEK
nr:glycosyltransferase family 2 protein [Tenacibaculum sp.]